VTVVALELITALVLGIAGSWVLFSPLPIRRPHLVPLRVADVAPRVVVRPHHRRPAPASADSPDH
jgi:hypothetical protein